MTQQDIRIPDIGDAENVEVIEILVAPGALIALHDPLIVIESDKASMEVPAPVSGKLLKITVVVGDKVREGQVIAVVESQGVVEQATEMQPATGMSAPPPETILNEKPAATPVLRRFDGRVPDIGDAKDVVVVEVGVKPGQLVAVDDLLVVVESDKASMEIPSPFAGRVASVDVVPGAAVVEGTLLVVLESDGDGVPAASSRPGPSSRTMAASWTSRATARPCRFSIRPA